MEKNPFNYRIKQHSSFRLHCTDEMLQRIRIFLSNVQYMIFFLLYLTFRIDPIGEDHVNHELMQVYLH